MPREEMTEDWDRRNLSSCLFEVKEGELVIRQINNTYDLGQIGDKDAMSTSYQLDSVDDGLLVITHRIGQVVAVRKCRKCKSRIF